MAGNVDGITYEVEGLLALQRKLARLEEDGTDLKDAGLKAAQTIVGQVATYVPQRTGNLLRSHRARASKSAAYVLAGSKAVPYANAIHWGSRFIKGNPWLSNAARGLEHRWRGFYDDALNAAIRKAGW